MKEVILNKMIECEQFLDDFLIKYHFSKKQRHLLKMEKRITVNDKIVSHNIQLHKNDCIKINCTYKEEIQIKPYDFPLDILYEDELVLIISKPIHTIVHSDGNDTMTVCNMVANYYLNTNQKCSIHPIHRLDRDTSGCLFFCKNPYFQPYFDHCMEEKKIKRTYLALVHGRIEKKMKIDSPIGKDRHSNKYRVSKSGIHALTYITPIKQYKDYTLIECLLETGRTHQIRVHCSSISHPLVGDELYGRKESIRCALHSHTLIFYHPLLEKEITITSPLPKDIKEYLKKCI